MSEFELRNPAARERFRTSMETASVKLPVRISDEDQATVVDADGRLVCVADMHRERPDAEACQIALWIVLALNACGGIAKD